MSKHEYYIALAEYWFEQRDYETCAYYRVKAKKHINEQVRQAYRMSQKPISYFNTSKETLVLSN